jgi:hypothetical protein
VNLTLRIKQVVGLVQGRHHHYLIAMLLDIAHEKLSSHQFLLMDRGNSDLDRQSAYDIDKMTMI